MRILAEAGFGKSEIVKRLREIDEDEYIITSTMSNSARLIKGSTIDSMMYLFKKREF